MTVHFRKPKGRPLPARHANANAARSAARSAIEHVSAGQKHRMKLFARTVGVACARVKIGMANLACDFTRLACLQARTANVMPALEEDKAGLWQVGSTASRAVRLFPS